MPIFETDEERSYFTTVIPVHKSFLPVEKTDKTEKTKNVKTNGTNRRSFEEIKNLIVDTLTVEGPLPTSVLVKKMNYKKLTAAVSNAIKELIKEHKICYEEEKLKSRNQRLRIC